MRRRLKTFAALCLFALAVPALAQEDVVLRNFEGGAGANSVGIVDASEDTEVAGPQAIYSGDNGEIYLLDQVNNRVLQFDPARPNEPAQTLLLPEGLDPTDLIVRDNVVYVWDGAIHALEPSGPPDAPTRGLSVTRSLLAPDEFTVSAFAQMGSQTPEEVEAPAEITRSLRKPETQSRARQSIASRGKGPVAAQFSELGGDSGVTIAVSPKGGGDVLARLKLQVSNKLGAAELLEIDRSGRFYVLAENVPTTASDAATSFIARYAPNGALEGVHELPLNPKMALSRRFVTVSPDGEVFFMRTQKGKADVLGVGFRPLKPGVIELGAGRPTLTFADLARPKGVSAVRPLTRQQVIETGFAFANVKWKMPPSAYGQDPDSGCSGFNRIRRPGYMIGKLNQEVQGVPYCWGCQGSLAQFAANVNRGMLAGNVCTRNDPRRDVAGVDCSSFVSAAWGLSTHFTTIAIPSIARELPNPWDLLPGDALNKPGSHVILFVRFTPDKKAEVLEASPGACNGRVCRNVYPLGALLARGYHPVRFRGLANETAALAPAAPAPAPKPAAPAPKPAAKP